jgi:large subunit ribosomal protein L28
MSRKCQLSGVKPLVGNNVSHANNRTKRRQYPNLQSKKLFVPEMNRYVRVKLSAKALKAVSRQGLLPYLRKQGVALKDIM